MHGGMHHTPDLFFSPGPDDEKMTAPAGRGRVKSLGLWARPPLHRVAGISPPALTPTFSRQHPRRFTMGQRS